MVVSGRRTKDAIEFVVLVSMLKHTVDGNYNCVSVSKFKNLAGGDGLDRVQR